MRWSRESASFPAGEDDGFEGTGLGMRWLLGLLAMVFVLAIVGAGAVLYGFYHFGRGLPDYDYLVDYEPPVVTRVHAGDGRLLAEFARNERVFVPIEAIPKRVVKAFLAAEDKN